MKYKEFGIYIVTILISIAVGYIILSIKHGPEVIESWIPLISGLACIPLAFLFMKSTEKKGVREEDKRDEKG